VGVATAYRHFANKQALASEVPNGTVEKRARDTEQTRLAMMRTINARSVPNPLPGPRKRYLTVRLR